MSRTVSTTSPRPRKHARLSLGWVFCVFAASLATVACVIVVTAWIVGGRTVPHTPTVQELLPPEPPQRDSEAQESVAVSALHPPVGVGEDYLVEGTVTVLPGSSHTNPVKEVPLDQLDELKSLGWAVPYLSRSEFEHNYAETSSGENVRTIQVHLTDGTDFVNVAETRPEAAGVELNPLADTLHNMVDLETITPVPLELGGGYESLFYHAEDSDYWTSAVETPNAQYVITSSLSTGAASEITTWVLMTDRSRVQLSHSVPGPVDRLERGFDEMRTWFGDE